MTKIKYKKKQATAGQAATELAVFGAILIFLLGTIVRTAAGNGFTQNQNFKAMRMAMLDSWNGAKANNISRNSASILIIEDRLSPDSSKYGDMDRNPYIANSSGTFTYLLMYPLAASEVAQNLPIMDVYIDGQHFPFTTAAWKTGVNIPVPSSYTCQYPANSCAQNQCLRNQREWVGGYVFQNQFQSIVPLPTGLTASQALAQMQANASAIFQELITIGLIAPVTGPGGSTQYIVTSAFVPPPRASFMTLPLAFQQWFENAYPSTSAMSQLFQIQNILVSDRKPYKLFYTIEANGTSQFSITPPVCANLNTVTCKDKALSSTVSVLDANGKLFTNTNGEMEYDLLRMGNYGPGSNAASVDAQFPTVASCAVPAMRCDVAWQWAATAGTVQGDTTDGADPMIGLNPNNNQYPTYDVDGRLKEVTIYAISQNADGSPTVSYEDFQGGDYDTTWDTSSCGVKPGMQSDSQIFTFTKSGTFLQIKEGKLFNPETGQVVRSINQRDTVDLIQRLFQLSNNTGRFCNGNTPLATVAGDGVTPNPVEACVDGSGTNNCYNGNTFAMTCFDTANNMLYVRSRIENRGGHYWVTNASGQLQVH